MFIPKKQLKRDYEIHTEYIFKDGMVYNVRNNIEQQFEALGDMSDPNGPKILRNANTASVLVAFSPNTILEVDTENGVPILWGRCPAS
jgi:hypothetical protein